MINQWYLTREDQQYGPYSDHQMQQFIHAGRIMYDDLVWCEGMEKWLPVQQIPLFNLTEKSSPTDHQTAQPLPSSPAGTYSTGPETDSPRHKSKLKLPLLISAGLVLVGAIIIIGLNLFSLSETTGEITAAVTCKQVTAESMPVEESSSFSDQDQTIYLTVTIDNARRGNEIEVAWYSNSEPDADNSRSVLLARYTDELPRGSSQTHFSIEQPYIGWEGGDYVADIIVEGRVLKSVPFTISK